VKDKLQRLVQQAVRWLPITSCYQCGNRDTMACRCLLTDRKRNRHPATGIPAWCPLPNNDETQSSQPEYGAVTGSAVRFSMDPESGFVRDHAREEWLTTAEEVFDAMLPLLPNALDQARLQSSPEAGYSALNPDFAWFCPTCDRAVQNEHVTFQETHDPRCGGCGNAVEPIEANSVICVTPAPEQP